jgi:glyoxylase-like metal-dependent hydrolase (beta-lactamase superfamily II)
VSETSPAESRHFRLVPLAEGVFAALATDGGAAICNSGIIDLGGRTVVFDTFLTPQAAADLRYAIKDMIGPTSCIVVNSHYHNDHIWGNQAFAPDALILASRRTRTLITTAGADEFAWYSSNSAQRLEALRAQYGTSSEEQQAQLRMWIGYYEGLVEALPHLAVCMPDITYEDHLEIHGTRHTAELIAFDGAHTEHDTVLHLPASGIVFAGDLLFVGCHPYLGDGDPQQLLKALRSLQQLHATSYVPGHGPVGTADDLSLLIDYVEHCAETAHALVDSGNVSEDGFAQLKIAQRFAHWQMPQFYEANIRSLCKHSGPETGAG